MAALIPLVLMLALVWLLLVRPQQQRVRAHQTFVQSLKVGDEVVTAGGIFGTISRIVDDQVILDVAPGVSIRVMRAAINRRTSAAPAQSEGQVQGQVFEDDERGTD